MTLETRTLGDFAVDVFAAPNPTRTVLFAAGRGGSPVRHRGVLQSLADSGFTVIAPYFDMTASPMASADEMHVRLHRLEQARLAFAPSDVPLIGAGHSMGATLLLVMAGATAWTFSRQAVSATTKTRFHSLLLLTPPTQFFTPPGALDGVDVPVTVWAGGRDDITPPAQAQFLKETIGAEVLLMAEAGHFTFMDELPPNMSDPHPDRAAFLDGLAKDVGRRILASGPRPPAEQRS